MIGEIHVGDVGLIIESQIYNQAGAVADISSATVISFLFYLPDGTLKTKTGVFSATGSNGLVRYTTIVGDLSIAGTWKMQVYITMPGLLLHSDIVTFKVYPNLS